MFKIKHTTNNLLYKDKYLKYKMKYLDLRKKSNLINNENHLDLKMIGGSFQGHRKSVNSITFSPDGQFLASGSDDRSVRLWNINSGEEVKIFKVKVGETGYVRSVAFSPDSKLLVSGSGDKVYLWNIESGLLVRSFEGHTGYVRSVAFSPNGKFLVSGSGDKTVRLWNIESGLQVGIFEGHTGFVRSVAFSSDSKLLVSGSGDMTVRIWNIAVGKQVYIFEEHTGYVKSVAFSSNGLIVGSGSYDKTVRVRDTTAKRYYNFEGHTSSVNSIAFSPDNQFVASGSSDKTVRIWSFVTRKQVGIFRGHTSSVTSVAFFPNGQFLASGSSDNTVRIWNIESGEQVLVVPEDPSLKNQLLRRKLKKIEQGGIYDQYGMLNDDSHYTITLPEPTIGNFNPKVFYKSIKPQNYSFLTKRWTIYYTDKGNLTDNADIGGYSKDFFSHFARYCLYYNASALKKKKNDFNKIIASVKKDYYKLCNCFEKKNEQQWESSFFKTFIESCNNLTKMKAITNEEDETYLSLSPDNKNLLKDKTRNFKKSLLRRKDGIPSQIWWTNIKELIIENNSKLKKIKKNLDNYEKNLKWVPFVNEGTYLKINKDLDVEGITNKFGNVESFYFIVGIILGRFITQDLPVSTKEHKRTYAREYVPLGEFFSLKILSSITTINQIEEAVIKDHGPIVYDTEDPSKRLIDFNKKNSDLKIYAGTELAPTYDSGDKLKAIHSWSTTDADGLALEINVSDILTYVSDSDSDSNLGPEINVTKGEFMLTIPETYVIILGEKEDPKINYLKHFFNGVATQVKSDTGVTSKELLDNVFSFPYAEGKKAILELLKKEKERWSEYLKDGDTDKDKKLNILTLFIEIVNEITNDCEENCEEDFKIKLEYLFKYITATNCYPDRIQINFTNGGNFEAHTCSNGIDIPYGIADGGNTLEGDGLKETLKMALYGAIQQL